MQRRALHGPMLWNKIRVGHWSGGLVSIRGLGRGIGPQDIATPCVGAQPAANREVAERANDRMTPWRIQVDPPSSPPQTVTFPKRCSLCHATGGSPADLHPLLSDSSQQGSKRGETVPPVALNHRQNALLPGPISPSYLPLDLPLPPPHLLVRSAIKLHPTGWSRAQAGSYAVL